MPTPIEYMFSSVDWEGHFIPTNFIVGHYINTKEFSMRIENTKWGSRIITKDGRYYGFAWKAYMLVMSCMIAYMFFTNK